MSSSVSNISFRYHPEDEELDDNYDTFSSISTSSIKSEGTSEDSCATGSSGDVPSSVLGRLGIKEETDKWKLFREVKGRITKSVEEKIEEIKTERKRKDSKQRRSVLGQMEHSSVSDEEASESVQASTVAKSAQERLTTSERPEERLESDPSGSQGSSPERSTTPVPTPEDFGEDDTLSLSKKKGLKSVLKKKKGKTKTAAALEVAGFDKTTIAYSALCDDTDDDTVEMAQEVKEPTLEETKLAKELDRLANPTVFQSTVMFLVDWHIVLLPLVASLLHWCFNLPQYVVGFMVGSVGLLLLQRVSGVFRELFGLSETPMKQLKDLLPLTTSLPIFRRSAFDNNVAETSFEGWMNEYSREYQPETYHMTLTETVYVRLEGSQLRLSSPRAKVPKRALWNEPHYRLLFSHERLYDISNCRVELRPHGLIHRRIWSKKYPICVILKPNSRLGVRHKEKGQETVDEDAPWVDDDKYNFDTVSEESDEENDDGRSSRKSSGLTVALDDTVSRESRTSVEYQAVMQEGEEGEDFVKISASTSTQHESLLYLFARTDREKEIWFRRLAEAAKGGKSPKRSFSPTLKSFKIKEGSPARKLSSIDYLTFMLELSQRTSASLPDTKESSKQGEKVNTADLSISTDIMWLNAFMGRVLFDVVQDPEKIVMIQEKIQKKLSAIKLPMFLEKLEVSQLDLGSTVPVVQRASRPVLNAQGVWVDLDVVYEGGFKMTVDTKLNLDRIKQAQAESPTSDSPKSGSPAKTPTPTPGPCPPPEPQRKSAVYNSEVEDSAETSSEEPDTARLLDPSSPGQSGSIAQPKYIRFLDKVAQSKYFQQVVDYKFIKKFVQGNNLQLVVEVKGLLGTLVLNIPPPPSDRLWYGFRTNPKLWLSAQPKFGQHAVAVISRIIEKKLSLEFQRVLVLPNMDDFIITCMSPDVPS